MKNYPQCPYQATHNNKVTAKCLYFTINSGQLITDDVSPQDKLILSDNSHVKINVCNISYWTIPYNCTVIQNRGHMEI